MPNAERDTNLEILRRISETADGKLHYGDLWLQFSVESHVQYACYKAHRGILLLNRDEKDDRDNGIDDLYDALNAIRFAIDVVARNYVRV